MKPPALTVLLSMAAERKNEQLWQQKQQQPHL